MGCMLIHRHTLASLANADPTTGSRVVRSSTRLGYGTEQTSTLRSARRIFMANDVTQDCVDDPGWWTCCGCYQTYQGTRPDLAGCLGCYRGEED